MSVWDDSVGSAQWGAIISVGNQRVQSSGKKPQVFLWRCRKDCEYPTAVLLHYSMLKLALGGVSGMHAKLPGTKVLLKLVLVNF